MRLIDADALKKAFEDTVCIEPMPYAFVKQIIDNAPTVELDEGVIQKVLNKRCMTAVANEYLIALHGNGTRQLDKSYSVPDKGIWLYPNANKVIGKRRIGRSEKVCSKCGTHFTNNIPWDAKYCPECGIKIVTRLDICSDS